jgi:hypothetical protein
MGATIEAVIADQNPEIMTRSEVICIFCGLATPVPASGPRVRASHVARKTSGISIVRCDVCGKEAPYPPRDIREVKEAVQDAQEAQEALHPA